MSARAYRLLCMGTLAGVVALLWLQPVLALRMLPIHDMMIHLQWSEEFHTALREGWILPRWAAANFSGLGDPTFFYYQPLFYYINSAFRALGVGPERAVMLTSTVPYVLSAIIAYRTILTRYRTGWALAGAALVVASAPLLFVSTHMCFLPWSLGIPLSVMFVMESVRPQPRPVRLAFLLCLTCLGHLLSGLMALLCAGLSRLVLYTLPRLRLGAETAWAAGAAIGLGLAAFFVYPAVTQLHLINPDGWTNSDNFDWRRSLLFPTFSYIQFVPRWFSFQWPLPLMSLGMALVVIVGRRNMKGSSADSAWCYAVAALAALALGSELAYPLYAWLSPMQKLQFPYRFLPIASILSCIAFVMHLSDAGWRQAAKPMRVVAVLLILGYTAQALAVEWSLYRNGKTVPGRAVYMQGKFGQQEYLVAVRGPHWKEYVGADKLAGECAHLQIRCEEAPRLTHAYSAMIDTSHPVTLRLPIFAFPAWSLSVDGTARALQPDPDTGLVMVNLPAGRHAVGLRWAGLPAERTGRLITLAALGVLGLLLAASWLGARRRPRLEQPSPAVAALADDLTATDTMPT